LLPRRPGRFYPRNNPVLIVQEARWATGQVWMDAKNVDPSRFNPRNVASLALYRLS